MSQMMNSWIKGNSTIFMRPPTPPFLPEGRQEYVPKFSLSDVSDDELIDKR